MKTNSNNVNRIDVSMYTAPIISSRDTINVIKNLILKSRSKNVELDFSNISIISRSAAHELLVMKEDLSRKFLNKKNVEFVNANELVMEMLRVVASNRAMPKKEAVEFNPEKTSMDDLLKKITI